MDLMDYVYEFKRDFEGVSYETQKHLIETIGSKMELCRNHVACEHALNGDSRDREDIGNSMFDAYVWFHENEQEIINIIR